MKKDEERLRKLINFVKPLQLPEPVELPEYQPQPITDPDQPKVEQVEESEPETKDEIKPPIKEPSKPVGCEKPEEKKPPKKSGRLIKRLKSNENEKNYV